MTIRFERRSSRIYGVDALVLTLLVVFFVALWVASG